MFDNKKDIHFEQYPAVKSFRLNNTPYPVIMSCTKGSEHINYSCGEPRFDFKGSLQDLKDFSKTLELALITLEKECKQ